MFLKKLILQGFKSFAERTEFEFGPGMTGIVGPNGCGKSNVLDATRWVLGEQSARSLRGAKMLDVIFNGSRSRKAMNFAEVELIFDNATRFLASDTPEVSVARTLYRSGESEYRLNGNACRLKDVRDLLLDTGVGVDAYSIIEQGRVDMMLQANPTQRRELFEEAAGVSRYKVRRAEAQRKLERTQNNVLRLNDLLEELERQLRSVKLAAGKARRWQELDRRWRELRCSFALAEYHALAGSVAEHAARLRDLSALAAAQRAAVAAWERAEAAIRNEERAADERVREAEERGADLRREQESLRERIVAEQRRAEELADQIGRLRRQAAQSDGEAIELERRLADSEQALADLSDRAQRDAERLGLLRQEHLGAEQRTAHSRGAIESIRRQAFDAARSASLIQNELQMIAQQQQRGEAQLQQIEARRAQWASEHEQRAADREKALGELAGREREASELTERVREIESEAATIDAELEGLSQEVGRYKEQRGALLSRLGVLEELEARQEGVEQGARWLLAWRDEGAAGVLGLVADLLSLDDPRVALLESALAQVEGRVVVADSHAFLAELRRREAAPAALDVLALDRVPAARGMRRYADAPGVLACAADWVRCDEAYRPLAEALLGRVYLVNDLERALALAEQAEPDCRFVTPEGWTVAPGGRLSLGGARGDRGLISRKAHIRQVRADLDEVETALERAHRAHAALEQQRSDVRLRRGGLLDRVAGVQRSHGEARSVLARLEEAVSRLERESRLLDGERAAALRSLSELGVRAGELSEQQRRAEESAREFEARMEELSVELGRLEQVVGELARSLTAAEVDVGRTEERRVACERNVRELRVQLEGLRARRIESEQAAEGAQLRREQSADELRQYESLLERRVAESREHESVIAELRGRSTMIRRRASASASAGRCASAELEQCERAVSAREMGRREAAVRCESLESRVRDELGLELAELHRTYVHADQDWEAIRAEIDEAREKIARLGNVNLDSIRELEELTPRHETLAAQKADLVTSIGRLEALIQELDEESRARFAATFEQIRGHFVELFRKLFGGGKADVLLEDPTRPLESGIEIIARPPGKEPQSISLLSGGERTMTAVALLFAVFRSKPSPFAILDEVDAALDEANIDRFNRMLMEFVVESQFIVITHNKRTMHHADVLYGVTMQEPGVSKRVSVRFEDRVEAPIVA